MNACGLARSTLASLLCVGTLSQPAHATSSDSGTLTVGEAYQSCPAPLNSWTITYDGYSSPAMGSYSPTGLTGGANVLAVFDLRVLGGTIGWPPCVNNASFLLVSGFSSDPGVGWLSSVTCHGVQNTSGNAGYYSYSNGQAEWMWYQLFGLTNGAQTGCTIVHN